MSCALNPLIYAYGMPNFRKAFREFLNFDMEQNTTGATYSCCMRSSIPPNVYGGTKNWIRRYPESFQRISTSTPIIKRNLNRRGIRRQTIDIAS
uniref:G_PROTEIN_RECEP_F1_2 domain-containing protein n=1 Tax=Angiostrongylus cantonensis TaxID=6313 RepID=A0A0K0CTS4_ANGCA